MDQCMAMGLAEHGTLHVPHGVTIENLTIHDGGTLIADQPDSIKFDNPIILVSAAKDAAAPVIESRAEPKSTKRQVEFRSKKQHRFSGFEPRDDTPCEWCRELTTTTIEEIWSKANPNGRLVRLCKECGESCASG